MSRVSNKSFYGNKKWTVKRAKILKRDGYECQNCRRYFRSKEAKVVHHIYFYEDYAELGLMNWNLVSLCDGCHNKMHNRLTNEATKLGKEYQSKRKVDFNNYFKNKNKINKYKE